MRSSGYFSLGNDRIRYSYFWQWSSSEAGKKRAKKIEGEYALGLEVAQGHRQTPAVGRHDNGDAAAMATLEVVQATRLH